MELRLYDTTTGSGNPSALIGGSETAPWLSGPSAELIVRTVNDQTATAPAAAGKLLVRRYTNADAGGSNFIENATLSQACPRFGFGVVLSPPGENYIAGVAQSRVGEESIIVCEGPAMAFCTTGATTPIAAGTLLGADGAGNLTPIASPAAGEVLAIAIGALAVSQAATLVPVIVGGY